MADVLIRQMKKEDIKDIIQWTSEEGWSLTAFDLGVFRECHPQDFFVAEVGGRPVGTIGALRNDDSTGILGCFIVNKEFRGTGIGRKLMKKALDCLDLSEGRHVCVNSMEDVLPLYVKHGFTEFAFDVIVCKGSLDAEKVKKLSSEGVQVKRITRDNLPLLVKYASRVLKNTDWSKYFQIFVENEDVVACVALKASGAGGEGDTVVGVGMATPDNPDVNVGCVVQPLYADSLEIAGVIVKFLHENQPLMSTSMKIKVLSTNPKGVELVSKLSLPELRRLKRQYFGGYRDTPAEVFSISNSDVHLY